MTRRLIAFAVFALVLVTTGTRAGHAKEVVEILLRGHYYVEPATVQITVAVEPDEKNRALRIEADGERLFRASELSLEGAEKPLAVRLDAQRAVLLIGFDGDRNLHGGRLDVVMPTKNLVLGMTHTVP